MESNVFKIVEDFLKSSNVSNQELNIISENIEKKIKKYSKNKHHYTFIDLFAGIGGMRLGFEAGGGKCVFSSEWDANAQKTYFTNFGEIPHGDITKIPESDIPKHDILLAGFPCQAFSIAGERKGFEDSRGTLFFDVARIIKFHRPGAFLLENVKGLLNHENGETFEVILDTLNGLGYEVSWKVLNTMDHGNIPQTRERIYIVGFNKKKFKKLNFGFPQSKELTTKVIDLLDTVVPEAYYYDKYPMYKQLRKEMINEGVVYQWRRKYVRENKSNVCPTLTANMGTGGHNVPLIRLDDRIRKLTPKECSRLQGFPEGYYLPKFLSNSHLYKQFGNSVSVPVIERLAKAIAKEMTRHEQTSKENKTLNL